VAIDVGRRPGQHAQERVRAGLRTRRRLVLRDRLVWLAVGLAGSMLVFALARGGDAAWFSAGVIVGSLAMAVLVVTTLPLGHERSRADGAEGERATAEALRPLEADGWKVVHDVQTDYGNLDHVADAPGGTVFLLETKNLGGVIDLEGGVLTQRFEDDPLHVRRLGWIASRVRGQAAALADARSANGSRPWVQGVVVLWGDFRRRPVELDRVWYVRGDELAAWLRARC
jgi:nuclease-like protein